MAATALPAPGTEFGPCATDCAHVDCAESRAQAAMACDLCKEPIDYDNRFYQRDDWKILTHQLCYLRKLDQERRAEKYPNGRAKVQFGGNE